MAKFSNLAIEYFMKYIFNNLKVLKFKQERGNERGARWHTHTMGERLGPGVSDWTIAEQCYELGLGEGRSGQEIDSISICEICVCSSD